MRYGLQYKKVDHDEYNSAEEYGNLMSRGKLVACGISKRDAIEIIEVFNAHRKGSLDGRRQDAKKANIQKP